MQENIPAVQRKSVQKNGSVKLAGWGDKTLTTGFYGP